MSEKNPWKTLSSREVYCNPWLRLREDKVIKPNGTNGVYGVVETKIATGVVAITKDEQIYLVGQFRYPTNVYSWEIPEGGAEKGELPLEAAKRELREEAGVEASSWEQLGSEVHLSNCISNERSFLFLARDLREVGTDPDDTEVLSVKKLPFAEAVSMVDSGKIFDAMSIIGILRAARMLKI